MDEALVRKLRLPQAGRIAVLQPPAGYLERIGRTGENTTTADPEAGAFDFVQLFAADVAELNRHGPAALQAVKPGGLLWICYPKGSGAIKSDLNRDRGWETVRSAGWEGVSLVSLDDNWSAMRFRPLREGEKPRAAAAERRTAAPAASTAQPLEVPSDLADALKANPEAEAFFAKLAPSHRKEYIRWIIEAKQEKTRQSRIGKAVQKLAAGLKRPSDKT
jgi:hypothetical protein